jgi:Tol biopolymer transport system component
MVTREELRQLIWPEKSFGDFDHAINRSIAKLRSALGDSPDAPHLIETLPRRGYRFIGTVEMEACAANYETSSSSPAAVAASGSRLSNSVTQAVKTSKWVWLVLPVIVGVTAIGAFFFTRHPRAAEKPRVIRSYIKPMNGTDLVPSGFAISLDGSKLAYVAQDADGTSFLWVRAIDSLQAQKLGGTEGGIYPFWSPDSRSIGFFADGKLKKIDAAGGTPVTLCDAPAGRGGAWSREGVIIFSGVRSPLMRVSDLGGTATAATSFEQPDVITHRWPHFLPDGNHFIYVSGSPFGMPQNLKNVIKVGSLDSKESKVLLHTFGEAQYATGRLLYLLGNSLMAQPFDVYRLELTGEAQPIADRVRENLILKGEFSASETRLLVYMEGNPAGQAAINRTGNLNVFDRSGKKIGGVPGTDVSFAPKVSPDGKRIVYSQMTKNGEIDIWSYDLAHNVNSRLTFATGSSQGNLAAVWSPDGQRIAYTSIRNGKYSFYSKASDGSGEEREIPGAAPVFSYLTDWSLDGETLIYNYTVETGPVTTGVLSLLGNRKPFQFLPSQFSVSGGALSPDGKWLAYESNETGESKVYVAPFPGARGKWQVSAAGGQSPRWRRDGKELYYYSSENRIVAVEIHAGNTGFEIGNAHPLFDVSLGGYDVSPDGQNFYVVDLTRSPAPALTLVENWDAELKRK